MAKLISMVSNKGGVGKTSAAMVIAGILAKGSDVLLIDSDPNRSALGWAKRSNGALPFTTCSDLQASAVMMKNSFDYVIVDTKARLTESDLQELTHSDLLICCSTAEPMGYEALVTMVGQLPEDTLYRCLIGLAPPANQGDGQRVISALEEADIPCFSKPIRRLKEYVHASEQGRLPKGICMNDWEPLKSELLQLIK